ncbi:MAG TPA: A/G-specific adenine glycosylase [Ktedonobacterales bacterium]|nr:A/G-specific adenine glycosylase [Ktedonobacterales bacterium]
MTETTLPADERVTQAQLLLLAWYERVGRKLPWRETNDPYAILVSEMMLQQTQVDRVLPKYREFLERFPTLAALAEAPTAEVIRAWAPLGYNMRAVRLQAIARQVVAEYQGQIPASVTELLKLKGVGRYTAGAIACFAYQQQVATVDTNIRRVLHRLFVGIEKPEAPPRDDDAWELAEAVLPDGEAYRWNQALMDLGATVCTATTPTCETCPMQPMCCAYQEVGQYTLFPSSKGLQALLQQGKVAAATRKRAQPKSTSTSGEDGHADISLGKVAETPAVYKTQPFTSTTRYFRGRIVDALRLLAPGERMNLMELGPQVKADFSAADLAWLFGLTQRLARDGLIALHTEEQAPVDESAQSYAALLVSLP